MSFHNRRRMLMSTSTVYVGPGKPSVKTDPNGNITDYVVSEEYDVTDTGTDTEFIPFKSGSGFVLHIKAKMGSNSADYSSKFPTLLHALDYAEGSTSSYEGFIVRYEKY